MAWSGDGGGREETDGEGRKRETHWKDVCESSGHPIDTNTLDRDHNHRSSDSFTFGFCCWLVYLWILLFQPQPGFHSTDLERTLAHLSLTNILLKPQFSRVISSNCSTMTIRQQSFGVSSIDLHKISSWACIVCSSFASFVPHEWNMLCIHQCCLVLPVVLHMTSHHLWFLTFLVLITMVSCLCGRDFSEWWCNGKAS
jgi:hypothetical protein